MTKLHLFPFVLLTMLAFGHQVLAISDAQYRTIERLGELNGVALECGYFDETRHIKKALIRSLPKRRQLGEAFEEVTRTAFMEFIEGKEKCPDAASFSKNVSDAIRLLKNAFPKK